MFKGKRAVSVVLSAAMILSMGAAAGCSTPEVAMTVGDTTYSTGDYLAYLYNTYSQVYQNYNFAMYAQYGMDPWEITIPYGDDEEEMAAEDYIVKTTQDAMIRQKAIKDKLEEYGLSPRPGGSGRRQSGVGDHFQRRHHLSRFQQGHLLPHVYGFLLQ